MVRTIIAALLFVAHLAQAAPVALDLKAVAVPEFVDLVFKGILKRDYVLGPGIPKEALITISLAGVEKPELEALAISALKSHGIEVQQEGKLVRVNRVGAGGGVGSDPSATSWMATPGATPGQVGQGQQSATLGPLPEQREPEKPDEGDVFVPKHRSPAELGEMLKLFGLKVSPGKGGQVVFGGKPELVDLGRKLLQRADLPLGLVDVRALLVEYSDSSESGRSFAGAFSVLAGKLGIVYRSGANLANSLTFKGSGIDAVVSAIDGDARFRQLAEPRLRVIDGAKGKILVGSEFPVRGRVETDKGGNAVAAIEYKQAGISLELAPVVLEESVLLNVKQSVSSVAVTTSSGIDSPTVLKREAETTVDVRSGDLVVIGGLDDSRETDSRSGVTWLPDMLRSSSRGSNRTQILLLLEVKRASI